MISLVRGAATTMNSMRVHLEASPTTRVTRASGDRAAVYNALVLQYMEQRRTVESFFSKIHEIRSVHEFVDVAALNSLPTVIRIQSNSFSSINEFNFMNHSNTSGSSNHMNNYRTTIVTTQQTHEFYVVYIICIPKELIHVKLYIINYIYIYYYTYT